MAIDQRVKKLPKETQDRILHTLPVWARDRIAELERERDALKQNAVVWRHVAQEQYAALRRELAPKETGYAIEGALDSLFAAYRKTGKFNSVFCSQCGGEFAGNYHGYSHCEDHAAIDAAAKAKP
jgi:hypothetical protein